MARLSSLEPKGFLGINMAMALHTIEGWIAWREPCHICVTGVHRVPESQWDETQRRYGYASGLAGTDVLYFA